MAPKLGTLADQGFYFGTTSWQYEGWLGSTLCESRYQTRGKRSQKKFDDSSLSDYDDRDASRRPLLAVRSAQSGNRSC